MQLYSIFTKRVVYIRCIPFLKTYMGYYYKPTTKKITKWNVKCLYVFYVYFTAHVYTSLGDTGTHYRI